MSNRSWERDVLRVKGGEAPVALIADEEVVQ